MDQPNQLQTFAEDIVVFRQLQTPDERAEFSRLMKRAYAQRISACRFVRRGPGRHVSARIRSLCEASLPGASTPSQHQALPSGETASITGTPLAQEDVVI
jgi:hypothetical protein